MGLWEGTTQQAGYFHSHKSWVSVARWCKQIKDVE